MLEKLLLAATITLSLNLFLGASPPAGTPTESGLFSQETGNPIQNLVHRQDDIPSQQIARSSAQLFQLR